MRLFLDANVLFSAAKSDGPMRRLLALLRHDGHELCADDYGFEEAQRNLALKVPQALVELEAVMRLVSMPSGTARVRADSSWPLPPKDQPVLEGAIRHECEILVTGDKSHFGALYGKAIEGVTILSPAQVAAKLLSRP